MGPLVRDFPLFPLGLVALPTELVPLHIFEERYKTMMARVLEEEGEFGIVWVADDGLRPVGCACEIAEVLERMPDGRLNLVARGTRVFRIEARQDELAYPAGVVEFLARPPRGPGRRGRRRGARGLRRARRAGDRPHARTPTRSAPCPPTRWRRPSSSGSRPSRACSTCARSPPGSSSSTRLFRGAIKRLDFVERAQARARSNGKVHFDG